MRRKKEKFEENTRRENVIEPGKDKYEKMAGQWSSHFKNDHPLVLELACGYGEYTTNLAEKFPNKNFIGVDIKGDRIWMGSSDAIENNLVNAAFLRTKVELIDRFFEVGEVEEIWVVFPDPRPKKRDAKRRLTHSRFLELYKKILRKGGLVNLKTDNRNLFEYSLEVLDERNDIANLRYTFDLDSSDMKPLCFGIETRYEKKFRSEGEKINYLRFNFL